MAHNSSLRKTCGLHILDRGSYTTGRAVKMHAFSTLWSVKKINEQIFRPAQLVVRAENGLDSLMSMCLTEMETNAVSASP